MAYTRYGWANLAQDTITPWITAAATTVTVDSKGSLFPAHNGTTDYDYPCVLEQFDTSGVCTKREMMLVTAKTGNQFTITRSFGSVPWSDSATSQGTTAYAFDEWARFSLVTSWELIKEILDWLDERVTKADFQKWTPILWSSSVWTDSYAIAPTPAITAYEDNMLFRVRADVANTGTATLAVSGLAAKTIKKNGTDDDLENGDIEANQIFTVVYNSTEDVRQYQSQLWEPVVASWLSTNKFTSVSTWNALTVWSATVAQIVIDTTDLTIGILSVLIDGTESYTVDGGTQNYRVLEASSSVAIQPIGYTDMSTASYASKSLSVTSQESSPRGMTMSADWTKAYVIWIGATVYQYTLSTAWDISTGSYASKSMSVSGQDSDPQALFFSPDGATLYVAWATTDVIYQYTLSTPWDVSTWSYASKSLSVSAQEATLRWLALSNDGTKAYVIWYAWDTVYQYTLSTARDISTGSYASKSLSVASEDTAPSWLYFSYDGSKVFVMGSINNAVYQYSLSTKRDVSTGSYDSVSFSVNSQDSDPQDIVIGDSRTKFYVVGRTNDTLYQYSADHVISWSCYATVWS